MNELITPVAFFAPVAAILGCTWHLSSRLTKMETSISDTQKKHVTIERDIRRMWATILRMKMGDVDANLAALYNLDSLGDPAEDKINT